MILEWVPPEILVIILSYCKTRDIIQILRANKRLHSLRQNQFIWKTLLWEKHKLQINQLQNQGS